MPPIRLPNFSVLDHNLDRLLRDRQQRLASYQYQGPQRIFRSGTSLLPSGQGLPCVTTLSLCIQSLDDCTQAASILKHSPRVKSLAILLPLHSIGFAGSLLLESICGAVHTYRGPLQLSALRFHRISLAGVGPLLQNYVVLQSLRHLQLLYCRGVDSLLQGLSQRCASLQSFALEHCEDVRDVDNMNDFLRATTLRRLVLRNKSERSSNAQGLVSFDTLASPAHALECLVLDNSSPRHCGHDPEQRPECSTDFQGLCKSLQSLQQLCVPSPTIDKKQWVTGGFLEFLVSIHTPMRSIFHKSLTKHTGTPTRLAQTSSPEARVSRVMVSTILP